MNSDRDDVESLFLNRLAIKQSILNNTILSEEGGRFYHEENQNVIINIEKISIKNLPDAYLWVDYRTLNQLVQTNNCLNIQLRNLLSLLEV